MLLNNNTLKIMAEFCSDYNKRIYGRNIANKLKINQKTVSNILTKLEKEGILKYSIEGKNKYYFLNKLNPQIKDNLKIIEIERKNHFLKYYKKLAGIFENLEMRSNGIVIIFGSYANFSSNEKSDLDIFVISKNKSFDVTDLEELYDIKINIIKSNKEKIDKEEIFIKEIIKNHIILKGVENFIESIW